MKIPAALFVAAVAVAGVAAWNNAHADPRTVTVTIRHSAFVPEDFVVKPGETVRFVVRNTDPIDHEFIVGDSAVQKRHEDGTEARHGAVPGEISIPAGRTASTTYTFGEPGVLIFGCHLPRHYDYGMRGIIAVR